jgi:hypothetical protein
MDDYESLRIKLINQIKTLKEANKSFIINNAISELINVLAIEIFGTEEQKADLTKRLDEDTKKLTRAKENNEKGYLPYFDSSLEPISQEFGCPYCGEYCYPVNYIPSGSYCESECEFSGQTMIYCPKKKCKFELFCQSTMVPLGMILDDNSHYGYNKNESFAITYRNKIYTFVVKSDYLTAGMLSHFIHEFVSYNLTRKEITEYVWLESIEEMKKYE